MSAIFISHSSSDDAAAVEVRERLAAWGYTSVFLDFDPEVGIPAGRDWERELYHQLRTCGAVLVLVSERSMASHWCFAEITHAKSLGKPVFPLRVSACDVHPVLTSRQVLDLTADREAAYRRLERALKHTLGEGFPWDRTRPPYPGLMAFQEDDAAVFFGRREEIREGLERLERLRRYGAGRALMVLGASGSGKSSLMRAGLVPRWRRDERDYLVVGPFRPLDRPWRELAVALAKAFAGYGRERSWRELRDDLEQAAAASLPSPEPLLGVARDLCLAAGRGDAKVLLAIDQAEELLGGEPNRPRGRFAPLLQAALAAPQSPVMVVATLRTDLLTDFQSRPATRDLEFDDLRLGPMTPAGLAEIVEGPARVAGVDLEDGLAEAILDDVETADTLPLLAFALRQLYERCGDDRRLTLEEYRDGLGGLAGSVARAAESTRAARPLSAREEELFQDAMLSLVDVDDEARYTRRAVRRGDLPAAVHEVMDRFVESRLLVVRGEGDGRVLEVAHEALFRSWDRLRAWLDENREFLLWRKRLSARRREWERAERHPSLLLAGPALEEGRRWLARRVANLDAGEWLFLDQSLRRSAARRLRRAAAAAAAAVLLILVAIGGLWLWRRSEANLARAVDSFRVAVARELLPTDPTRAAQVLLEVADPEATPFAVATLREVLGRRLAELELTGHTGPVTAAAFSPDGRFLATASWDQSARIWPLDRSGEPVELAGHGDLVTDAAFSPDGTRLLTEAGDGSVWIWPASGGAEPVRLESPTAKVRGFFGPRGDRVLAVAGDGTARVWPAAGGEPRVLGGPRHFVLQAAFGPGGDRIVTVAQDGSVASWPADRPGAAREIAAAGGRLRFAELSPLANRLLAIDEAGNARVWRLDGLAANVELASFAAPVRLARFSPLGGRLLTVTDQGKVGLWDLEAEGEALPGPAGPGQITAAAFSPAGDHLALVDAAGKAWLWALEDGALEELKGHAGKVTSAAFSPRGDRLATTAADGTARVWKLSAPRPTTVLRGHARPLVAASFSPGGDRVLTASLDGTARIWPVGGGRPPVVLRHGDMVTAAAFDATGDRVLTVSEDGAARLWPADGTGEPVVFAQDDGVEAAALDPGGERLALASWEGELRVWPADGDGEPVELGSPALSVRFDPRGERLVTGSLDGTARVWKADGGAEPVALAGHEDAVGKALFSPDGRLVATVSRDKTARVWPADGSGEPVVLRGHTNDVVAAAFDPRGRRLVTASNDFTVRICELDDPLSPIVLSRHTDRVTTASFSPDGRRVVSASGDGTAMVWSADGAGEPLVLAGHGRRVTAAAFSPDGSRVVTAAEDATARIWLISAEALRRAVASAVSACLEPDFRRHRLGEGADEARRAWETCRGRAEQR